MKRFYASVTVMADGDLFGVMLDGRRLKSPAKRPLALPTEALAEAIAHEWAAQDAQIAPASMPLMKLASTAIDWVAGARTAVAAEALRYAETDLLCYRATEPMMLVERQSRAWQPLLDWAADTLGAELEVTEGLLAIAPDPVTSMAIERAIGRLDLFRLTAVADLAALTKSIVIALALERGRIDAAAAIGAALLDDRYQIERWGEDAEAVARLSNLSFEIEAAARFLDLLIP